MIRIVEEGDRKIAVLKLVGNPLGEDDARTLREKVYQLRDQSIRHIVLDMESVRHINSAGLGGLIAAMFTMTREGGDLRIAAINTNVEKIFATTHLDHVLKVEPSVDSAIRRSSSPA
jgi:anti-anti-sigma factor